MKCYERHDNVLNNQQMLLSLIDFAKQRGVHPDKLLKGTKIFYPDLQKHTHHYSAHTLLTVIENCSKLVNSHDISFLLGRRYFPSHLGIFGQALMNCRHLADMLRVCQCFQFTAFALMSIIIRSFNDKTYLVLNSAIGKLSNNQQVFITEFLLSAMLGAIKYRSGHLPNLSIHLAYPEVKHIEQYHMHIETKVFFSQQISMITIDTQQLYRPFNDSSSSLRSMALREVRQSSHSQYRSSFMQLLTSYIVKELQHHGELSLDSCAKHFGYSSATLKRKLTNHQLNYQDLIDSIRHQQAIFQIVVCQHNNEKIANSLHFNDVSNFRRAFKRWTGTTPNTMREQLQIQ